MFVEHHSANNDGYWRGMRSSKMTIFPNGEGTGRAYLQVWDYGTANVYDIQSDGTLANRRLFAPQGSDGMTLDENGNLYLTRGGVQVYSPNGKQIGTIKTPEGPANVCFGGKNRRTLFMTARTGFYSLRMQVHGQ